MDQLCLVPGLVHGLQVGLGLPDLLALDDQLALLDAFEEVEELGVLEAGSGSFIMTSSMEEELLRMLACSSS